MILGADAIFGSVRRINRLLNSGWLVVICGPMVPYFHSILRTN